MKWCGDEGEEGGVEGEEGVKMSIGGRVNMRDAHTVRSHTQRTRRNTRTDGAGQSNSPVELTT